MTMPEIREVVPHSGAMSLLDRVLAVDSDTLVAEVAIHPGSMFYSQAMQGVGSWVGIEYMAQAIAAHAGVLAKQGVSKSRLRAMGYGMYCPVDPAHNEKAWEKNRRVEFKVVASTEGPTGVELGCDVARAKGVVSPPP